MRMRQIQASSMQEAMKVARKEIGDDAVMLRSDTVGDHIIVTFGFETDDLPEADFFSDTYEEQAFTHDTSHTYPSKHAYAEQAPISEKPAANQNSKTSDTVSMFKKNLFKPNANALHYMEEILIWHGTPDSLHSSLIEKAQTSPLALSNGIENAESLLSYALENTIRFAPIASAKATRAIMLVGAHGAGKTFAVAKLATDAVKRKNPVRVITTDTLRSGAIEQLSAFTTILNIQFDVAESRTQLRSLIQNAASKPLTIIDSAGCNPYDFMALKQLGEFAKLHDVEPVLVLPLGIDANEAQEIAGVFSFLDIERLLITRVDCARRFGGVLSAMTAGQYALSHVSQSNRVGDGCPTMNAELLAHLLLRPIRERLS